MQKQKIINEIIAIIRRYLPLGYKIVLFGSWAKGNALPTSDIDIGIIGARKVPFETMMEIKRWVREIKTLRSIDVVDLKNTDERFKKNVLKYAKTINAS